MLSLSSASLATTNTGDQPALAENPLANDCRQLLCAIVEAKSKVRGLSKTAVNRDLGYTFASIDSFL